MQFYAPWRFFSFRQRIILLIICIFACYSLFLLLFTNENLGKRNSMRLKYEILTPTFNKGILGNYEPTKIEIHTGPGEQGKPVHVSHKASSYPFGYNDEISELIALNRSITDSRNKECRYWSYPKNLPTASVILVFYFESLSVVFRTVESIINRSPKEFLKEVILVDDGTDKADLIKSFDKKAREYGNMVRLIRNKENEGLIAARTIGAKAALGDVVIFLDAHCEVNVNWLPPLLSVIMKNPKAIAVPIIDGISWDTFEYKEIYGPDSHPIGIFEWGFFYKEMDVGIKAGSLLTEPYRSPTHAGGLLAIDRLFFKSIGYYDDGLLIWGGEQYELSFKTWMCHGEVFWVPCSRIGHIYRGPGRATKGDKYRSEVALSDLNHKRVVDSWFDEEHKAYFYRRHPELDGFTVDISRALKIKENLKCKSFKWFMDNVASEMLKDYPYPSKNLYWGNIRSLDSNLCLNSGYSDMNSPVILSTCSSTPNMNMLFRLDERGHIGVSERGIYFINNALLRDSYQYFGKGPWNYDAKTNQLKYYLNEKMMCLTSKRDLALTECSGDDKSQMWVFEKVKYSNTKIYKD